ncbi:MAG: DUF4342 domain-containing protein [Halanaerobium sp.]|nr:DUF4342 domain-containing protein [Halanaerobium sp.]
MNELEKVDIIKERLGVSYEKAYEALQAEKDDLVKALIRLEKEESREEITVMGHELVQKVKEIIKKGNVTKVRVKHDGKVLVEIPVTLGVAGALILPQIAVLAGIAALVTQCTLEVERPGNNGEEAPGSQKVEDIE